MSANNTSTHVIDETGQAAGQNQAKRNYGEPNTYENASNENSRSDDSQHLAAALAVRLRKHIADKTLEKIAEKAGHLVDLRL